MASSTKRVPVSRQIWPDGVEVDAIAAQKLHEADGEQAGAAAAPAQLLQVETSGGFRQQVELDSTLPQRRPGIEVGGEFAFHSDDAVAGLPVDAERHRAEAFGGILQNRNFPGSGSNQAGQIGFDGFVVASPLLPVRGAVFVDVGDQVAHRLAGGIGQRRDGGVVEVGQLAGHRELLAASAQVGHRASPLQSAGNVWDDCYVDGISRPQARGGAWPAGDRNDS